jgi:hypothetical protein
VSFDPDAAVLSDASEDHDRNKDDAQDVPGAVDDHAEVDVLLPADGIDGGGESENPAEQLSR